jgi:hypothetical protein
MSRWHFIEFCSRFLQFRQEHEDTWTEQAEAFFQDEAERKWKRYPTFVKKFKHFFLQMPSFREKGIDRDAEPSIASIVKGKFFPLIRDWIVLATSMAASEITLDDARVVYEQETLFKCHFFIPATLLKILDREGLDLGVLAGSMHERDFVHLLFSNLVKSINHLFKVVANNDWQLAQVSNLLELRLDGMHVTVLVSFNGYKAKKWPDLYFRGNLITFMQDKLCVKLDPAMQERLTSDKQDYLELARDVFFNQRVDILGVIKHFRAKALLTNQISHFYELLAAIISKLDLGVKNVQQLLQEYADAHAMGEQETMLWSYLLDLVVRQAMLYETFQSNLISRKGQDSIVFMIVLQYYLIDFRREAFAEKIFNGEKLHDKISKLIESEPAVEIDHFHDFANDFQYFLVNHFKIQDMDGYDVFIERIFGRPLDKLLARFFTSFLKTSHEQVIYNLEILNAKANMKNKMNFEKLVAFLENFLEFCMEHVFFQQDLETASRQFKDPSHRFSPTNIATGLYEVLLYRELPFHENKWMETLAIQFRTRVDMINVLDVKKEFESISSYVLVNFLIHEASLKPTTMLLHERLFEDIIAPFHKFNHQIRDFLKMQNVSREEIEAGMGRFFQEQLSSAGMDSSLVQKFVNIVSVLMASRFSREPL